MRVFVFYMVGFETNSSRSPSPKKLTFPLLLPSTNQVAGPGLLGLTGRRVVQALTKNPPGPNYCDHWLCEMHTSGVYARETHALEVYANEMHAHETHAYEGF
jgi:hypothetical protein